jgi:tRNA threonylcarbamoyladenosine modification (KEOPS) complex  Pcc1 subunit
MDLFFSLALKQNNISVVVWIFRSVYSSLCEQVPNLTAPSFEDVLESVRLNSESVAQLSIEECFEYAELIYEAILKMENQEINQRSIDIYFDEVVQCLEIRADGNSYHRQHYEETEAFLFAFKQEVGFQLNQSSAAQHFPMGRNNIPAAVAPTALEFSPFSPSFSSTNDSSPRMARDTQHSHLNTAAYPSYPPQRTWAGNRNSSSYRQQYQQQQQQQPFVRRARVEIEGKVDSNDDVIRTLQYIRKGKMDMIFPQLVHDKVKKFF